MLILTLVACSVKAHKNFLRKSFKRAFIGDKVTGRKSRDPEYNEYLFTEQLVAKLEPYFPDRQSYSQFWKDQKVSYVSEENLQQSDINESGAKMPRYCSLLIFI